MSVGAATDLLLDLNCSGVDSSNSQSDKAITLCSPNVDPFTPDDELNSCLFLVG